LRPSRCFSIISTTGWTQPGLKIIDVFVCNLRKTLARATGGNHYIETVWGRDYMLRDPAAA
jgi:two-component system cell cycle response regulator CtrA